MSERNHCFYKDPNQVMRKFMKVNDDQLDEDPKISLERLFYGTHETQVSEGGEADLHKHFGSCAKNPGHKHFVPIPDFTLSCLPEGNRDEDILELIRATADLTVRVAVTLTSGDRPEFWPHTDVPYPFFKQGGSRDLKLGTGIITHVYKYMQEDNKKTCQCLKCKLSDTPSEVSGEVLIYTAAHVVFDETEASHTTCRLFYDRQSSPLVRIDGLALKKANVEEDWCLLKYVTCDLDFLMKVDAMKDRWRDVWQKVTDKYHSTRNVNKLTVIVSHPHGCPKQVSLGQWLGGYNLRENITQRIDAGVDWEPHTEWEINKRTYNTCTCPGSSGAYVYFLGNDCLLYDHHLHSGVNFEGTNFSGPGTEYPTR